MTAGVNFSRKKELLVLEKEKSDTRLIEKEQKSEREMKTAIVDRMKKWRREERQYPTCD